VGDSEFTPSADVDRVDVAFRRGGVVGHRVGDLLALGRVGGLFAPVTLVLPPPGVDGVDLGVGSIEHRVGDPAVLDRKGR